jgi:hypothetical protein
VACFQCSLFICKDSRLKGFEVRGVRKNLKDLKYKVFVWRFAGFGIPVSSFTLLRSSVTCSSAAAANVGKRLCVSILRCADKRYIMK